MATATPKSTHKYAVYALNEDGDLHELEFLATDKQLARFFAAGLDIIRDAFICEFELHETVPKLMEVE